VPSGIYVWNQQKATLRSSSKLLLLLYEQAFRFRSVFICLFPVPCIYFIFLCYVIGCLCCWVRTVQMHFLARNSRQFEMCTHSSSCVLYVPGSGTSVSEVARYACTGGPSSLQFQAISVNKPHRKETCPSTVPSPGHKSDRNVKLVEGQMPWSLALPGGLRP
jgi:hypothetical protein